MKYIKPILISTTLLAPVFSYGLAVSNPDALAKESGFGGYIGLMTGYSSSNNQMIADNDNKDYNGENSNADNMNNALILPYLALNYTFDGLQDQIFLRNYSAENFILAQDSTVELGYTHLFANKTKATFSILGLGLDQDAWKNPYKVGKRDKTHASIMGFRGKFENIYNSGIGLDLAYGKYKLKDEESPNLDYMDRNSKVFFSELSYLMKLSNDFYWRNAISYEKNSADGKAMSFNGYGYKTSFIFNDIMGGVLSTNLSYENRKYGDEIMVNSLPQEKRKDNRYKIDVNYAEAGLFGYESLAGTVALGYEKQDSNIDFYSFTQPSIMVGAAYTF